MKKLYWFIILDLIVILLAATLSGQAPVKYGPQVVLVVDRTEDGVRYVIPRASVFLTLIPYSGPTVRAPVSPGDYMLCHDFNQHEPNDGTHVAFLCGSDIYLVKAIGIKPPKD